ncbi:MAG: MlaD family protein [Myxococcota bacterium]|nr:MlaD family protein [Myxococcota bacterium]
MAKSSQAAKVGLFVTVAGVAAYGIYHYVSPAVSGSSGYTIHAYLHDGTGLAAHSRVTIAGIPVAAIDAIKLENGQARIDVKVRNDVALYENATLGKKSTSLLGESAVVLTPGTPDYRKLRDGDEIHLIVQETTPADVIEQIKAITDDIKQVSEQLAKAIGTEQGGQNMKAILQNLADATEAVNTTIRENRETIHDTLLSVQQIAQNANPEIVKILENVRVVTQDVREMMAANQPQGGGKGELRDTVERLDRSSKSLESALGHIDNVTGRIDRGEGTIGKLTKDEQLVNEVQEVAEGINDYVQNIRRLQTIVGLRSDYNFLANSIKTYVQIRLQPTEDKYYLVEIVNEPRGALSITNSSVDTTNPNMGPNHYSTTTTNLSAAFLFSLEFAKRVGPFTGRFGIIESTGGLGIDMHLLQNRFEIQNDLFGFAYSIQPRYRLSISYEFIKHLWLLGGVDNVFTQTGANGRDYFLGLQLRFTDEDLKTILPFAGGASAAK